MKPRVLKCGFRAQQEIQLQTVLVAMNIATYSAAVKNNPSTPDGSIVSTSSRYSSDISVCDSILGIETASTKNTDQTNCSSTAIVYYCVGNETQAASLDTYQYNSYTSDFFGTRFHRVTTRSC